MKKLLEVLEETGAPAAGLELEINENLLMVKSGGLIAKTQALSTLGIGISLAHPGTGYSSLSPLKRLALEVHAFEASPAEYKRRYFGAPNR